MQLYETFPLAAVISRVGVPTDMMKRHRRREKVEEKRNFPPSPSVKKEKRREITQKKAFWFFSPWYSVHMYGRVGGRQLGMVFFREFLPPPSRLFSMLLVSQTGSIFIVAELPRTVLVHRRQREPRNWCVSEKPPSHFCVGKNKTFFKGGKRTKS